MKTEESSAGVTVFFLFLIVVGCFLWRGGFRKVSPVYLKSKKVLITGGAHGLGRHLVGEFLKLGAVVVVFDVDEMGLENLQQVHGEITIAVVDLADTSQVIQGFEQYGPFEIIVNNAAVAFRRALVDEVPENITTAIRVNALAPMVLSNLALGSHRCEGLIFIGSTLGYFGAPKVADYAATKHAIVGFYESLRRELRFTGVQLLLVNPHYIHDTSLFQGTKIPWFSKLLLPPIEASTLARNIVKSYINREEIVFYPFFMKYVTQLLRMMPNSINDCIFALSGGMSALDGCCE